MDTQPPQPGPSGSKSSRLAGTLSNASLIGTQQEHIHQLVHCDAANIGIKNITQDAHLKIVHKTGSSTNKKQLAGRCEFIHTVIKGRQLTIYHIAGVRRELRDQFITARNRKPPWPTKVIVRTVGEIKHHDVGSSVILAYEFPENHPHKWTKKALITLAEATEAYVVEVLAASHCLK